MSIFPVIARELKAQARQPFTYWLRVLGGVSVGAAFAFALWRMTQLHPQLDGSSVGNQVMTFGTALFGKLNLCIFLAIWVLVPLSVADSISRERREGTLSLLYLTELRSWGIIVGKTSAHVLRALSLFITMAPWLILPLLFGGVELRDLWLALMLNSVALVLAFSAGLLASTIPRDWLKSVVLAELLALALFVGMLNAHETVVKRAVSMGAPTTTPTTLRFGGLDSEAMSHHLFRPWEGLLRRTVRLVEITTNSSIQIHPFGGWNPTFRMETHWQFLWANISPMGQKAWFQGVAGMWVRAALLLVLAIGIAATYVNYSWRDRPRSAALIRLRERLLSPRFGVSSLRRNLSRSLSSNPIGWLQQYSASARLVKWGWCLFIVLVEIVLSSGPTDLYDAQTGLGIIMLLGLAFSATGSFRNELETGAFELLLVTPLPEIQIVLGRLRGLWQQFLPALVIYATGGIYLTSGWAAGPDVQQTWVTLIWIFAGFFVVPIVGLFFSIQRMNFFVAWICASAIGLLPAFLAGSFGIEPAGVFVLQLMIGVAAAMLLERSLRLRRFLALPQTSLNGG